MRLPGNRGSTRISQKRLADLDTPTPALPPEAGAYIMESKNKREKLQNKKRKKKNHEQNMRKQECGTENANNESAKLN